MAKKSREYWEERFAALEEAQSKRGAEYFAELEKQYNRASASVQRDIERWYTRFAVNNEITLQEARKLLTGSDLEEFHWNVMEYIEKGRTLNYSTQWARQLENASARVHVSRLEALKLQMQNHVEVLYGNEMDDFAEEMKKIYTEGYYHTAYEIQKGFNIGYDLMRLDTNKIEKVISRPWAADGSNFSDRIWKQKSQLVSDLHNNLTQAIIRGQNPHVVTEAIARRFNVSKGQAGRLVMTESAFFNSASNYDCYKDLGVEQYEILATLDTKTSDICRALDGKVFDMKDYAAGVTAPPFHVWCRTTTVPYFDDEFELDTERAARDENGKTYFVPADMKYEDWYKTFVDNGRVNIPNLNDSKMKTKYEEFDSKLFHSQGNDDMISRLVVESDGVVFELDKNTNIPFAYFDDDHKIFYNPNAEFFDMYDMNYAICHELSHAVDFRQISSWKNEQFNNAIRMCSERLMKDEELQERLLNSFLDGGAYAGDAALSDLLSALSNGMLNERLPYAHDVSYWEKPRNISLEVFANISSIDIIGYDSKQEFDDFLRELYNAYEEVVKFK